MTISIECSNIETLLDSVKILQEKVNTYNTKKNLLTKSLISLSEDAEVLKDRKQMIDRAKQRYLNFVDVCYLHSIKEMEDFVNIVLEHVFIDERYRLKLDITNKYNKSISFYIIDEKKNLETPLRKGNGKGIKAVVSFVLLTYYLIRMKAPYVFLDESFVNISAGYVERFFDYVRKICHEYNMCVVLITHDSRFIDYADKIYNVDGGVVTRCV